MRILLISGISFPPDLKGCGAERSAYSLAQWLHKQGHEVGVFTTAKIPSEEQHGVMVDGLKIWQHVDAGVKVSEFYFSTLKYRHGGANYGICRILLIHATAPSWPAWLDEIFPKPDEVNIHSMQGIGYNALHEISTRRIPAVYFLHLLDLSCHNQTMFKNGHVCEKQCTLCKVTSTYKKYCVEKLPYLGFCSPSHANLERIAKFFPIKKWDNTALLNANLYPAATVERASSDAFRILYVGRLDAPKGIDTLIDAAALIAKNHTIELTVIGTGPEELHLHTKYGHYGWCKFTGFLTEETISNYMVNSDVLCVPSLWPEVLGGVIVHALSLGLPVLGSNMGGIPELIEHRKNAHAAAAR